MAPSVPVRSVKKALDLLDLLAFEDLARTGMSLSSLAARLGMPSNTAHNLLKTMAVCGYVAQTASGAYVAGPRCAELAHLNHLLAPATQRAIQAAMESASRKVGETLTFAILSNGRRVLLLRTEGGHVIRVDSDALEAGRLFAVPTGRVLVAFSEPREVDRVLEVTGYPGTDWNHLRTRASLDRALTGLRKRGCEVILREGNPVVAFAVPVILSGGHLLGALGCYAPTFRCGPGEHASVLACLRETAAAIAEAL